ncbi:MAG TPA: DUF1802 family protein [Gemmataceae bacterium]|jgi:hypothetical protein|nr:DUF1802 family protein [Gemmataceae bacterium]
MLQHALKEWAAICKALALGRQTVILRKGGIDEKTGRFTLEHQLFWLYPTFLHQKLEGLHPEAEAFFHLSLLGKPPEGQVRLTHFAAVTAVYELHDIVGVYKLQPEYCWSQSAVESRFTYGRPGLHALVVRVYRSQRIHELPETPGYAGCKSWVELDHPLGTDGAVPVVADADFEARSKRIEVALQASAMV